MMHVATSSFKSLSFLIWYSDTSYLSNFIILRWEYLPCSILVATLLWKIFQFCRAILWDIRKNQARVKPDVIAELDRHIGPVIHLHMDSQKRVTGTREDVNINIWEAGTGNFSNSLTCCSPAEVGCCFGCSALAADGYRIVTAAHGEEGGLIRFQDFKNASCLASVNEVEHSSKFWDPLSSYSEDDDWGFSTGVVSLYVLTGISFISSSILMKFLYGLQWNDCNSHSYVCVTFTMLLIFAVKDLQFETKKIINCNFFIFFSTAVRNASKKLLALEDEEESYGILIGENRCDYVWSVISYRQEIYISDQHPKDYITLCRYRTWRSAGLNA